MINDNTSNFGVDQLQSKLLNCLPCRAIATRRSSLHWKEQTLKECSLERLGTAEAIRASADSAENVRQHVSARAAKQ